MAAESTTSPTSVTPDALRTSIDELATRVVLYGIDESTPAALKQLSESASSTGFFETATEAVLLARRCKPAGDEEEAGLQACFREGLSRLLQVLEQENRAAETNMPEVASEPAPRLSADPELVADFVAESREHLGSIEAQLLVLEHDRQSEEAIHAVFRGFHTIKGLAGFLDFPLILEVAHEVETLLELARNRRIAATPILVDVVLEAADYLKGAIKAIEANTAGRAGPQLANRQPLVQRIRQAASGNTDPNLADSKTTEEKNLDSPAPTKAEGNAEENRPFSVRVDTQKLERLMDAVGELLVAQSAMRQRLEAAASHDQSVSVLCARLARITADVQHSAMSMRMVPVGQLFGRSARVVRDLSRKLGKQARYESKGENIEVDKTIAEHLSDPLLHMVRNALDHGIEMPDDRARAGKDPTACVRLSAYQKGAEIVIEISDDGKGLDRDRILAKAIENGLTPQDAELSDSEVFALIFEPGFSTASAITDLSGRGVGMDIVRKNLAKLRGRIDIESQPGRGSNFYLRMPLTLAIIEGLIVGAGNQQFVIPMFDVREIVRITPGMLSKVSGRHEMALVRGNLLPVIRLASKLGVPAELRESANALLVITECEGKSFAVWIDELVGSQDVAIKSLSEGLRDVHLISGCTILADGRVGLILDMAAVCRGRH